MRNSIREHHQQTPHRFWRTPRWVLLILLYPFALAGSGEFSLHPEDMVAIRADQGWEDEEPNIVHFEGHFEMHVRDWQVMADQAILYGKLDDPERLVAQGAPVRFEVSLVEGNRSEMVLGEAREVVYERETRSIHLNGGARLVQGENVLQSSIIEYDIKSGRFRAKGEAGVQITAETVAPGF